MPGERVHLPGIRLPVRLPHHHGPVNPTRPGPLHLGGPGRDNVPMQDEGPDPVALQSETPYTLARLIEGVPDPQLSRPPAPGKWSVRAILAHMAEDELVSTWRYRQMIEHPGTTLQGFDQDLWARLGDYDSWSTREALEMFRLLREANLRLFSKLEPDEWQRHGIHAERGRITVEDLARHMASHDWNHIRQIEALL
jgi:hypothetical protein